MKAIKEKVPRPFPLLTLSEYNRSSKIWLNPTYQRESVWTKPQKQLFIDSILNDIDIPKLYFRKINRRGYEFEVVDGQQRLRSIFEFLGNEFKLSDEYSDKIEGFKVAGMKFADLPDKVKNKLNMATLDVVLLNQAYTNDDIDEMFTRLQNGEPLNAAEKRRAVGGNMRKVVMGLAKHNIFNLCDFKNKRYAYEDATAKSLHMFIKGTITDIKPESIRKTYTQNKRINNNDKHVKELKETFDFIHNAFRGMTSPGLKKFSIITLSYLVNNMLKNSNIRSKKKEFAKAYLKFENTRGLNQKLPAEKQNSELSAYTAAARSDTIPDMDFRYKCLKREMLKIPNLKYSPKTIRVN